MQYNRYRQLECEYALAAHECEMDKRGRFKTIATVNLQMAEYYGNKADALDAQRQESE